MFVLLTLPRGRPRWNRMPVRGTRRGLRWLRDRR
jgi:hypothetical protein